MTTGLWIICGMVFLGFFYFFLLPWVPPLYQKYRAYIQKKAGPL